MPSEYEPMCTHLEPSSRKALHGLFILWLLPLVVCYYQFGSDVWLSRLVTVVVAIFFFGALVAFVDARWEVRHRRGRKTVWLGDRRFFESRSRPKGQRVV